MTAPVEVPGQTDLLDALQRVEEHADEAWKRAAREALLVVIGRGVPFTTDEVWELLTGDESTHEPRAMGPILRQAAKERLIVNTNTVRKSLRAGCHQRPATVWLPLAVAS